MCGRLRITAPAAWPTAAIFLRAVIGSLFGPMKALLRPAARQHTHTLKKQNGTTKLIQVGQNCNLGAVFLETARFLFQMFVFVSGRQAHGRKCFKPTVVSILTLGQYVITEIAMPIGLL